MLLRVRLNYNFILRCTSLCMQRFAEPGFKLVMQVAWLQIIDSLLSTPMLLRSSCWIVALKCRLLGACHLHACLVLHCLIRASTPSDNLTPCAIQLLNNGLLFRSALTASCCRASSRNVACT